MQLDPKDMADRVVRNNMGVEAIELAVRGKVAGTALTVAETGQTFPVEGGPTSSSAPWLIFDVVGFDPEEAMFLRFKAQVQAPLLGEGGLRFP
ncbi:MAG: hypothetical protein IPM13_18340 [Phycisphaerales bacterium]|nr:hypothetical protein [Phycisphaerales bacterium]